MSHYLTVSGRADIVSLCRGIENNMQAEQQAWVEMLRACGVKAAHPDDGWVNRVDNILQPCYPQFDDGVEVGDTIALGWPQWGDKTPRHRLVRVVEITRGRLFGTLLWKFEPIPTITVGRATLFQRAVVLFKRLLRI